MRLRVLTPLALDFYVVPGASVRDPHAYALFWERAQARLDDLGARLSGPGDASSTPSIRAEHHLVESSVNRYRTIDRAAIERPVNVLTLSLAATDLPKSLGCLPEGLRRSVLELEVRVFDHGIAILEAIIDLRAEHEAAVGDAGEWISALPEQAVLFGESAARECCARFLQPLVDELRSIDRDHRYVCGADLGGAPTGREQGEALWVTRTLVLSREVDQMSAMAEHWLRDVAADPDELRALVGRLADGTDAEMVRWLNYLFVAPDEEHDAAFVSGRFADTWEGLRLAQYFYGSLERVDTRLSMILAEATAAETRAELAELDEQLVTYSQRAELIMMDRQVVSKYLKRSVRHTLDRILAGWDHDELVEAPVRFKIAVCDRRLNDLSERRRARSAVVTDVILLGIGVTSVLGTAVALTEFGRGAISDPNVAGFDLGGSSITQWIAAQPADAMIITGCCLSMLLVALYLYFRRES